MEAVLPNSVDVEVGGPTNPESRLHIGLQRPDES